jgi:hypothetical protein
LSDVRDFCARSKYRGSKSMEPGEEAGGDPRSDDVSETHVSRSI